MGSALLVKIPLSIDKKINFILTNAVLNQTLLEASQLRKLLKTKEVKLGLADTGMMFLEINQETEMRLQR